VADATTTAPGTLSIVSRIPLDILLAGRRVGASTDEGIPLPPGRHQITLVNTRFGIETQATVEIGPSAVTTHTAELPMGQLQVNAPAGSEIWVEGYLAGTAPLDAIPTPVGTRSVEVKHPEFGNQKGFVEVVLDGAAVITIDPREVVPSRTNDFPLPSLSQPGATIR
jgi:hypothetical protein